MNTLMHRLLLALLMFSACSCTLFRSHRNDELNSKDSGQFNESISIKDLISTLPAYSYHECSLEQAKDWLNDVKIERVELDGKDCESVIYPADGCVGSTRFYLDRVAGKFWKRYYAWEPGSCDTLTEYKILNGKLIEVSTKDVSPRIPG